MKHSPLAISCQRSSALDAEAASRWGLHPSSLVERAGSLAASCISRILPLSPKSRILVMAGSGNNAADALVLLRSLLLLGHLEEQNCRVILKDAVPEALSSGSPAGDFSPAGNLSSAGNLSPRDMALWTLSALGVTITSWESFKDEDPVDPPWDLILDGIAGTGLRGPLRGAALEMLRFVNGLGSQNPHPTVAAIDIPSGFSDGEVGELIHADYTLAIEPQKRCLYTPSLRRYAGKIIPLGGVFPEKLINSFCDEGIEILPWERARTRFPLLEGDSHKYRRGLLEIRAGSPGSAGAARIAGRGAQAAGAGLVRLVVDREIYPFLAASENGVMVVESSRWTLKENRFQPQALLLGPGWGMGEDRQEILREALALEGAGLPLVLDADAIRLARGLSFHGNAILTPHPGEFQALTGIGAEDSLANPAEILPQAAKTLNACIVFKAAVMWIAAPDGRISIVDSLNPALGTGGSGDLLAGIIGAIAASCHSRGKKIDAFTVAGIGASLFSSAARQLRHRFFDPLELADRVATMAGQAFVGTW